MSYFLKKDSKVNRLGGQRKADDLVSTALTSNSVTSGVTTSKLFS